MLSARAERLIYQAIFVALLLFSAYALFYKLGTEPFQDYDEATYALVTQDSIARGNPTDLAYLGQPYFRKPPLLFWLTTASSKVFADKEFSARFPSALAGFLAILLVMAVVRQAGAGRWFALLGAAVLATTASWMEFARDVRFDNLVALCIIAAFYAAMRARRDPHWYALAGIFLGLAVLAKSVIAVFALVAILAYVLIDRGVRGTFALLRSRHIWIGLGAFLLVAVPWHLAETLRYGSAFWHSYLGTEVLERASVNLFPGGNNPTNAQYLGYMAQFAAPWTEAFLLALAAFPFLYRKMDPAMRAALLASLIAALAVLAVMLTAHTKAYGYLMPFYPFMAVSIALSARALWLRVPRGLWRGLFACALLALTLYGAARTRYDALHINPYYGWELGQAQEEKAVGNIIAASAKPVVYTTTYHDLGSILYYSGLPATPNPYVYMLSATSTLAGQDAFLLATSSLADLTAQFPEYRFVQLYSGRFVSLFTVTD